MSQSQFKKKFAVHFIGIGGVSMSALAKYLIFDGFTVSGSDNTTSIHIEELRRLGCKIGIGHKAANVYASDLVVYNSAIQPNNPEVNFALKNKIPIISRAQLLQMIGRQFKLRVGVAGSHGKTTVTSIIAHILMRANLPFTAHIGGVDRALGNLPVYGKDIFLSEVCEFNKNISFFEPDLALCLNVDNDHLNCYGDIKYLQKAMFEYLDKASTRVINGDDLYLSQYNDSAVIYGKTKGDYYAQNIVNLPNGLVEFDVYEYSKYLLSLTCDMKIYYTLYNILAAISSVRQLNIDIEDILSGLQSFSGVDRRNQYLGKLYNSEIYLDYAHHPTEIAVSLEVNKVSDTKTLVIFQPHTYSRTKLLFEDFIRVLSNCNNLIIYKTYAAREDFDIDGSAKRLAQKCTNSIYFENEGELIAFVKQNSGMFEKILVLGAGDLNEVFKSYIKKGP